MVKGFAVAAALFAFAGPLLSTGRSDASQGVDPNALWKAVKVCAAQSKSIPPCMFHSKSGRFVVIRDNAPSKTAAYLIVPTDRVTGIESPSVFVPPFLDFWQYGWDEAMRYVEVAPEKTGLAINSIVGRDQNQLHIHLSCVNAPVIAELAKAKITGQWHAKPFLTINNLTYNARKVGSLSGSNSPFNLVAQIPAAKRNMKDQTIAVVGAKGGGYYVIRDYAHGTDKGEAEVLLDERCT
jgi:CDP-diacylglycerol pyrophosphatase